MLGRAAAYQDRVAARREPRCDVTISRGCDTRRQAAREDEHLRFPLGQRIDRCEHSSIFSAWTVTPGKLMSVTWWRASSTTLMLTRVWPGTRTKRSINRTGRPREAIRGPDGPFGGGGGRESEGRTHMPFPVSGDFFSTIGFGLASASLISGLPWASSACCGPPRRAGLLGRLERGWRISQLRCGSRR